MEADSRAFFQELYSFLCFFSFSNTDSSNQDHFLFVVFVTLGFFFLFLFRNSSTPLFAAAQWGAPSWTLKVCCHLSVVVKTMAADPGLLSWKCYDCNMTFCKPGLLQKHKARFCVGGQLGDPDLLLLRRGLWDEERPPAKEPPDDVSRANLCLWQCDAVTLSEAHVTWAQWVCLRAESSAIYKSGQ